MKKVLIILTLFCLPSLCLGQKKFTFSIQQLVLPGGHISYYEFDGEILIAVKNEKRIEKRKLNPTEINHIKSVFKTIGLDVSAP